MGVPNSGGLIEAVTIVNPSGLKAGSYATAMTAQDCDLRCGFRVPDAGGVIV